MGNPLLGFLNQMPQTNGANGMSMLMNAMRSGGNPLGAQTPNFTMLSCLPETTYTYPTYAPTTPSGD